MYNLLSYQCGNKSNMAILDVQILSGCIFETQTVIRVSWGVVKEGKLQIYI